MRQKILILLLFIVMNGVQVGCSGGNQDEGPVKGSNPALDEDPGAGTEMP